MLFVFVVIQRPSNAASAFVKVLAVLIAYLPTTLATTVLPALFKPRVQISTDDALVQLCAANVLHAV